MQKFSSYQKFVVAILAFLQFTIILDFMIMSPLGAMMMPALKISPSQFGLAVSVYAFSAGTSALLAAGFADHYDRKKFLLFFYCGFIVGTLFCGLASTYPLLLAARMVSGLFGGVIGSIVLAITTDLFPLEMRGRVMGYLQTAFAASQVLGLPAGLYISNYWGWHAPFFMIVIVSLLVGIFIVKYVQPIDEHLKLAGARQNPLKHFFVTVIAPEYRLAFIATMFMSLGGFMLMPFGSDFTVHNVGISIDRLPIIYLVTGISSIFSGPLVGRAADSFGKFKVILFGSVLSLIMIFIYTNLGITPITTFILISVVLFVSIFSRAIPSQALLSAIPDPAKRGSFMSVNSSLGQMSGGIASVVAGLIVAENADGTLAHFNVLGYIIMCTVTIAGTMMYFINRQVSAKLPPRT